MEKYLCCYAHRKPYFPHDTLIEKIVESTSSSNNMHEVVDENSDPYRNMIIDAMRMNQNYSN